MDTLGDIAGDRLTVECLTCRRRGVYALARLVAQFGPAMPPVEVLRRLTASCRYQQTPEAPPAPKYQAICQARLVLPRQPIRMTPTPIQNGLRIEVWGPNGSIEWHLATVWSFEFAHLAFKAALPLYPDREVTLRQDCRVIAKRQKPE